MKAVKKLFIATILLITLLPRSSRAQGFTFDWGSSFVPAWVAGSMSNTALNVGGSGVNISVTMAVTGSGSIDVGWPVVNDNNATATMFEVQGSTDAIEIQQNLNNLASYSTTTINFSKAIQNLSFGISDIDRPAGGTPWDYVDVVTVTGIGPSGTVLPVLTKYNPTSTFVDVTSNMATGNITAFGGNATSLNQGNPDQNGTVFVDFGTNAVSSIVIQYGNPNVPGLRANPRVQAIALGNFSFNNVASLPASFLGFGAKVENNKTVSLNWKTGSAANSGLITIERSINGISWERVPGINDITVGTKTDYRELDRNPIAGISYYRLKESTHDGFVYYSKTIRVSTETVNSITLKTYPNPFHNEFQLELNWPVNELVSVKIVNLSGQIIKQETIQIQKGFQVISIDGLGKFAKSNYLLTVESKNGSNKIHRYIIQQ